MQLHTQSANTGGVLKAALLVYETQTDNGPRRGIATVHQVMDAGGKPVIAPGRHMTVDDYDNLVRVLNPVADKKAWRDEDVLYESAGQTIWWTPPGQRSVFFKVSDTMLADAKGVVPLPGLIWVLAGRSLSVYAYKGHERPTQKTKLYQAPFFNVYSDGAVCTGNMTVPSARTQSRLKRVEGAFFGSYFTHPNTDGDEELVLGHEPHQFWRDLLDGKHTTFPEDVLVPTSKVAGNLTEGEE